MSTSVDDSGHVPNILPAEENPPPASQTTKPPEQTTLKDEITVTVDMPKEDVSKDSRQMCNPVTSVQVTETSPERPESLQRDEDCSLYESDPEEYNCLMEDETLDQELQTRFSEMEWGSAPPAWHVESQCYSSDTHVELENPSLNKMPDDYYEGRTMNDCISGLDDGYEMKACQPATQVSCPDDYEVEEENIYEVEDHADDKIWKSPWVMPFHSVAVQTDLATADKEVSVDQDIVNHLEKVIAERIILKEQYQEMRDKQTQLENQVQVEVKQFQQKIEEELQHLNKTMKQLSELSQKHDDMKKKSEKDKREFAQKERDLKVEIETLYEKSKRLMKKQENKENSLASLIAEQNEEKELWDAELAVLKKEDGDVRSNILEETERAMKAEVSSLEIQRELASMMFDEGVCKAKQHISVLVHSRHPEMRQKKQEWEMYLADILSDEETILTQYNSHIQLIKNGAKLSSLPEIHFPILPPAPAEDFAAYSSLPPVAAVPTFPGVSSPDLFAGLSSYVPPTSLPGSLPHSPPSATNPVSTVGLSAPHKRPVPVRSPPGFGGLQEMQSSHPASKLDKLLEKLQDKFPQTNRAQMTIILQQIKTTRGTMAGLSMDELIQKVTIKLSSLPEQTAVGAMASAFTRVPPFPASVSHGNPSELMPSGRNVMGFHPGRPSVVSMGGRLCLMCQQIVQSNDQHHMACAHVVHRKCIKFWAQVNKNSSCPFCPCSK